MAQDTQEPVEMILKKGGRTIRMKFTGKDGDELLRVVSKLIYPGQAEEPKTEPITSFR